MELIIVLTVLVALAVLSVRFGVDSRNLDINGELPAEYRASI